MGIVSDVRSVLPSTNRNFESRIANLDNRVGEVLESNTLLRNDLASNSNNLGDRFEISLRRVEDRLSAWETERAKPSYCNVEYLSLNQAYRGRRILLAGWYGASNCGDELMMRSVMQHFDNSDVRVSVLLWDDPDYDFSRLPKKADQIHYPHSLWELRQLSEYFDVLVWGGGAIIDEHQFSHDPKNCNTGNLLIWLSEEMLKRDKAVYAIGLSANDTLGTDTEYSRRLNNIVCNACHVSLRDVYSRNVLSSAGVDVSRVELCEDVVFGNRHICVHDAREANGGLFTVGVVFMMGDLTREHNKRMLPHLIERLQEQYGEGYRLLLIPFYNYWKFDVSLLAELCDELKVPEQVEIARYSDELESLALLDCDAVVAYRYHACLAAAAAHIPTLFMCVDGHPHYRNKMQHIAELFGMEKGLLMSSTCLDDGSFDQGFSSLLAGSMIPQIPDGLFEKTARFLDRICNAIVSE